ncbi:hypothetical protein HFP15_30125 [Amycolatopsis sp. K13G38]|uniref:Uncharacterized protein n=1 Tax=Amycolatopsis acididurans TaxID=2724524 RepID=A0ABX1JF51_9PSEU|nr:hypothetical protein [Amycolatopsis acididurans]NKQ57136.1 hypothetical protein [Amycolatopsis acididurans]
MTAAEPISANTEIQDEHETPPDVQPEPAQVQPLRERECLEIIGDGC